MATLIKANNTTALNLAGAWTPSQVPTAADDLVFNATYLYATGATISVGGDVASASVEFGPVTSPTGALNLAQTGSAGRRLWTSNLFDFSETNANWQPTDPNVTLSSTGDSIAFRLGRPYTVSVAIDILKNVSVDVVGDVAGSASLSLQPGMSMDGYSFYAVPLTANAATSTVPGTENAVLSPYPNVANTPNLGGFALVQGHPTLPTAITLVNNRDPSASTLVSTTYAEVPPSVATTTINSGTTAQQSNAVTVGNVTYFAYPASNASGVWGDGSSAVARPLLAAYDWSTKEWKELGYVRPEVSGFSAIICRVAYDNIGNLYVYGTFSQIYDGATAITANRIAKYNIATRTWSNLGTGGWAGTAAYALACDSAGNLYVGGLFTQIGGLSCVGFARWTPGTSTWSNPGSLSASTQINDIAIDSSNNVHITGTFTTVAGTASQRYARWNPGTSTWTRYATGLNNTGTHVRVFGTTAYIGGTFTSAFGVTTTNVVALNTSTGVGSARSLTTGSTSINGLAVAPDGTLFCNSFVDEFRKWTGSAWSTGLGSPSSSWENAFLVNGPGGTILSIARNATNTSSTRSNIEPLPAAVKARTSTFPASVSSFDPATGKFTVAVNNVVGPSAYGTSTTKYPCAALYKGSSIQTDVSALHFSGVKTYILPPGQDVVVQFLNFSSVLGTQPLMFAMVRRGGALLESPEISTSGQVTISIQSIQATFSGQSTVVDLLFGVSDAKFSATSNLLLASSPLSRIMQNKKMGSVVLRPSIAPSGVAGSYPVIQLTEDATGLTVGSSGVQTLTGSAPTPLREYQTVLGSNSNLSFKSVTTGSLAASQLTETVPLGHPRNWPSNFVLGRSNALTIASPYFRVTDAFTVSAAALPGGPRGQIAGRECYVDWSSNTGALLGPASVSHTFREVRVSSFAAFPVMYRGRFYYTGAGETVSSALLYAGSTDPTWICGPDSGPLVFNFSLRGARTFAPYVCINNNQNNRWTSTLTTSIYVMGSGTLNIESRQPVLTFGNPTVTFDYSAIGTAEGTALPITSHQGGTIAIKGIPGQDLTLTAGITGVDTSPVYNRYLSLDSNGGTSLSILATSNTIGNSTVPMLLQGLSATNTFVPRFSQTSGLPLFNAGATTPGTVCILGANGDIDYAAAAVSLQPIAPYTTYAAMPSGGGTTTDIVSQSGSATLTGNLSARVLKLIPTSASGTLALSSFTLSAAGVLLAGNQGGTYTISGSRLTATHIINASNTDLRILAPVGNAKIYGNTVSFGSATTTYQDTSSVTSFVAANAVTKIYAGSDNQQPRFLNLGTDFPVVQEVQFLGSGTGRTFPHALLMRPGAKITCSSDWTFPSILADSTGSGTAATGGYWIYEVNAPTSVGITFWGLRSGFAARMRKTGAGKIVYQSLGYSTTPFVAELHYVEEGSVEIALTDRAVKNADQFAPTVPVQLLAGTSVVLNSTFDHPLNWVIWGDGSVVKNNTNTVRCLARLSQTGGFTVNAGEYDAKFRYAVGDGDVTLAGGTLRASDAGKDQYILEVAGDFIFAGGSLALGDSYV
jgi:hypothetical protein